MAAPSYTTDLTTYNAATVITGWVELTAYNAAGGPQVDTDLAIHGSACITMDRAKVTRDNSIAYDGTAPTLPTNGGFFIWHKFFAPNSLATLANGGVRIYVGSTVANYDGWNIKGNDNYQYGGWENYVIDPLIGTPDETLGGGVGDNSLIGFAWNLLAAPSKGNPFNVDIVRYGRGEAIFTLGDLANGYATFDGFALVNDHPTEALYGRSGLFQDVGGSYLWKGLMSMGQTGTVVDFRDSNVNITIDNTTLVKAPFNRIEINNVSSIVQWTSINISSLSTISKGEFEMIDNAGFTGDTCVFTDMSTFIFQSNATLSDTSFIRCGKVTTGGASFTGCLFDESIASASTVTTDLSGFTDCEFHKNGTNHAIELTSIGDGTMDWNNKLFAYVTGVAASPAATGTTGNEAIYVNVASGTLTINVGAGYTVPSIRTAGATVNVVAGQVTTTITVTDISDGTPVDAARVALAAFSGGSENWQESVTITDNGANLATVTHTTHGLSTGAKVNIQGADVDEYNGIKTITVTGPSAYTYVTAGTPISPATGTIISTTVFIDGVTNASGIITDTRSLLTDQPVKGRVRRATTGKLFKTSPIVATIDSISGLNLNVQMIPDE